MSAPLRPLYPADIVDLHRPAAMFRHEDGPDEGHPTRFRYYAEALADLPRTTGRPLTALACHCQNFDDGSTGLDIVEPDDGPPLASISVDPLDIPSLRLFRVWYSNGSARLVNARDRDDAKAFGAALDALEALALDVDRLRVSSVESC